MENKTYQKEININSTHLLYKSDIPCTIESFIIEQRKIISYEIKKNPNFTGYDSIPKIESSRILELMTRAGEIAEIGPMSAVAGSISQICLEYQISKGSKYSILENGGDIAFKTNKKINMGIYAGKNPFSNKIGFKIKAKKEGYGICTSSGTFGPSKSFGKTDATILFSKEASISDSLATRIGNYGTGKNSSEIVHNALSKAEEYSDYYDGVIVIKDEYLAKTGNIPKLVKTKSNTYLGDLYEII